MPVCDLLQSIVVLICNALHGNRPIPYSHYPREIQLRLQQGKPLPVFQTSSLLQHAFPLLTFNLQLGSGGKGMIIKTTLSRTSGMHAAVENMQIMMPCATPHQTNNKHLLEQFLLRKERAKHVFEVVLTRLGTGLSVKYCSLI